MQSDQLKQGLQGHRRLRQEHLMLGVNHDGDLPAITEAERLEAYQLNLGSDDRAMVSQSSLIFHCHIRFWVL
jgi:hypothetical protein